MSCSDKIKNKNLIVVRGLDIKLISLNSLFASVFLIGSTGIIFLDIILLNIN